MTVKELRKLLEECNDDAEVTVCLAYADVSRRIIAFEWQFDKNRVEIRSEAK